MKKDKETADITSQKKQRKKLIDPEGTGYFFCEVEGRDMVCSMV